MATGKQIIESVNSSVPSAPPVSSKDADVAVFDLILKENILNILLQQVYFNSDDGLKLKFKIKVVKKIFLDEIKLQPRDISILTNQNVEWKTRNDLYRAVSAVVSECSLYSPRLFATSDVVCRLIRFGLSIAMLKSSKCLDDEATVNIDDDYSKFISNLLGAFFLKEKSIEEFKRVYLKIKNLEMFWTASLPTLIINV
jgi:hypothetical protein